MWGLLLPEEGPRDGEWSPEGMVAHPTLVGSGTEGLQWPCATFERNPLASAVTLEQMWLQKEKTLKGMSVSMQC